MENMLELVKQEMRPNNSRLPRLSGIPRHAVLDELAYCFHPEVHEKQVASYGAVFCGRPLPQSLEAKSIPIAASEIGVSRRFADGRRSFLMYHPDSELTLGIFDSAFGDEDRLLELSAGAWGLVLQRSQTGLVKLAQNGEIYTVRGRTWSRKPTIREAYKRILACLAMAAPPDAGATILSLLRVCYYVLSPEGVGATLVWRFANAGGAPAQAQTGIELRPLSLSVRDPSTL